MYFRVVEHEPRAPQRAWASAYVLSGKRAFDIGAAALFLATFIALILLLALAVATDGRWPFFGHTRVGLGGREFRCWKIRTMVPDAEARLQLVLSSDLAARVEWARDRKLRKDPRVSPLGAILRRTSLDELPQFWNVLRGDMSLVGPRPVTRDEMERYGAAASAYLAVRPGLTGKWQVEGRNSITYEERVQMDAQYVRELSFWTDLKLLARTLPAVLRRTGV